MTSKPDDTADEAAAVADDIQPDPALTGALDLALAALHEITPASTVGPPTDYRVHPDGVVSLRFENRLPGYPGWYWTVSVARVEGAEPTVLEVELLPGDGALVAPEWVPWAERLADYHAAQAALAELADDEDADLDSDDGDDSDDDIDDLDAADFDSDGSPILHAGDVDGVDIDELSPDADDDLDEEDDLDDEDDDDEDEEDDDDEDLDSEEE